MLIKQLELMTPDLVAQRDYYRDVLELPVELHPPSLHVRAGRTELIFTKAPAGWEGAYHFAFNIPRNRFAEAKAWIEPRSSLLTDEKGQDEFDSDSWNCTSLYFKDAAENILEFIARRDQDNAAIAPFDSGQILQVSEIGLPSTGVISLAQDLSAKLGISAYRQQPNATFTPLGDEDALLILPVEGRIWYPNTAVPAKQLKVRARLEVSGREYDLRGVPYELRAAA